VSLSNNTAAVARDPCRCYARLPGIMREAGKGAAVSEYWGRDGLSQAILDALTAAGKNLDALTISVQRLVMGGALDAITRAGQRNREEGRIVSVQAVLDRP
jgi:hypothetical protein